MSFLIRAGLVIGVLSWLALQRSAEMGRPIAPDPTLAAAAVWGALPDALRETALREGAAEIARVAASPLPASRDTLAEIDRKVPWRGAQSHADRARLGESGERLGR